MKPMKIISTFVKEFEGDKDLFEAFRIWHSKQLNQTRIDGELCLSIHPLDYITMSDNNNGWISCMRWMPTKDDPSHGDFRGGTISCMNSPHLIIAYLHNPKHSFNIDDDWSWNSKQWRELFIVQDGLICEIKGYPFQDENLTNASLMWIKELAKKNLGWEYEDEEINVSQNIKLNNDEEVMFTFQPGTFMYKDIGTLPLHRGRINSTNLVGKYDIQDCYRPKEITKWTSFITIPYGGIATCMCCGEELLEDNPSDMVMCRYCDTLPRCGRCGRPIRRIDGYWVSDIDDPLCESCWQEEVVYDSFEDEPHLVENTYDLHLLLGYDEHYEPIWYDNVAYCYEPMYNWGYQEVFTDYPLKLDVGKTFHDYRYYVTLDMVKATKIKTFKEAFSISNLISITDLPSDYNVKYLPSEIES
jgi:hypothetical protein